MKNILRKIKPAARLIYTASGTPYCTGEWFCVDFGNYNLPELSVLSW